MTDHHHFHPMDSPLARKLLAKSLMQDVEVLHVKFSFRVCVKVVIHVKRWKSCAISCVIFTILDLSCPHLQNLNLFLPHILQNLIHYGVNGHGFVFAQSIFYESYERICLWIWICGVVNHDNHYRIRCRNPQRTIYQVRSSRSDPNLFKFWIHHVLRSDYLRLET